LVETNQAPFEKSDLIELKILILDVVDIFSMACSISTKMNGRKRWCQCVKLCYSNMYMIISELTHASTKKPLQRRKGSWYFLLLAYWLVYTQPTCVYHFVFPNILNRQNV
jgi:hypothetical protein